MNTVESLVASRLLGVQAVKLQPNQPFTWASGWKSPIYCDNRKTLSYPEVRSLIKLELARIILEKYPDVEAIAGVATGAALGSIGVGMCMGMCIGLCAGLCIDAFRRKKSEKATDDTEKETD